MVNELKEERRAATALSVVFMLVVWEGGTGSSSDYSLTPVLSIDKRQTNSNSDICAENCVCHTSSSRTRPTAACSSTVHLLYTPGCHYQITCVSIRTTSCWFNSLRD